ncbi:hypothetical protein LYNGBM3L_26010 [Moorena producens 3L]|uniref:Uncharacterized protein n=1 Tax=Moorena producens 3L TaxID=489825 RepID=F4XNX0_9CYAN|nr:hypothetical protein LYNGBM3L_26010 [Moorena producens 3L]
MIRNKLEMGKPNQTNRLVEIKLNKKNPQRVAEG